MNFPFFEICDITRLKPLEFVFRDHLLNLESIITDTINKPIIADINSGKILDGSHRYVFLYKEGYRSAPVLWVDYQDESISTGISMTKNEIVSIERLLPPRTTRHKFPFLKEDIPTNLSELNKGESRVADHLISNDDIDFQISHNIKYLKELEESREYILFQLGKLKDDAVFVGKFNPPHLGHAVTILNLKEKFNLTVVVTNDIPTGSKYTQQEIIEEIKLLGVNVKEFPHRLIDQQINPFPKQTILSGNPDVIDWCERVGARYKFIPRSGKLESKKMRDK